MNIRVNMNIEVINAAFAKAKDLDRKETLKKVERKDGPNRVKFVIQYDPRLPCSTC